MITDEEFDRAIREIDEELKLEGVLPHARGMNAIRKFGQRFNLSIPLNRPQPGVPHEVAVNWPYAERIFHWFAELYGERNKVDPSAGRKVAVLADGDISELRLPLFWGILVPHFEGKLTTPGPTLSRGPQTHNICNSITCITNGRLQRFASNDIDEVYGQFVVGIDVCEALNRFTASHALFTEAQDDLSTAVAMLTAQKPNYGQSRWASLQFAEKFMKGLIHTIGIGDPNQGHKVRKLHDELTKSLPGLNLLQLIKDVDCTATVRYGEETSTREQAYAAHKASLLLARELAGLT